jgi:signal transduction histidine kinase
MKKSPLILVLTLLIGLSSHASNLDSLVKLLQTQQDTLRVNTLNELSIKLLFDDVEQGRKYAQEAQLEAQKIGFIKGEAKALIRLGIACDITASTDSALLFYDAAIVLYQKINDAKGLASCYNNKAMIYSNKGWYERAITLYFLALKQFEQLQDELGKGNALNNIAVLYNDFYKKNLGRYYAFNALRVFQKIDDEHGTAAAYTNIALSYDDINADSSLYFHLKAAAIKEKNDDRYGLGITYNDIGVEYGELGKYDKAFAYLDKAYAIKSTFNDELGIASVLTNKASIFKKMGKTTEQLALLKKAYAIAKKANSNRLLSRITYSLAEGYQKLNQWKDAYQMLDEFTATRDTILNEESQKNIAELEARYQTEKKDLIIQNDQLTIQASEIKIKQSQTQITLLIAVLVTFLVVVSLIAIIRKERQKSEAIRLRAAQEKAQTQASLEAEDRERIRIAKDLHDSAGQQLAAVRLSLSAIDNMTNPLTSAIKQLDEAITEIRTISHTMMPVALMNNDFKGALHELVQQLSNSNAPKIDAHLHNITTSLSAVVQSNLYRVVQECLTNAIKHAQAKHITLQLVSHDNVLVVMIEDDGIGFNPQNKPKGLGLNNIRNRVSVMNGVLLIDSAKGTTITIEIPI